MDKWSDGLVSQVKSDGFRVGLLFMDKYCLFLEWCV